MKSITTPFIEMIDDMRWYYRRYGALSTLSKSYRGPVYLLKAIHQACYYEYMRVAKGIDPERAHWEKWGKPDAQYYAEIRDEVKSELIEGAISEFSESGKQSQILAIGSHDGGRLQYLLDRGYDNLAALDINKFHFELMEENNPEVYEICDKYIGSMFDIMADFDANEFDVIFTVAVLSGSKSFFDEKEQYSAFWDDLARVSADLIITAEVERENEDWYTSIFTTRGFDLTNTQEFWVKNSVDQGRQIEFEPIPDSQKKYFRVYKKQESG